MGASASSQAPTVAPSASNANASAAPKAPNAAAAPSNAPFATGGPAEVLTGGFFWPVSPKKSSSSKKAAASSSSSTKKATKSKSKSKKAASSSSSGKLPASLDDRTVEQLKARAKALGVPCISSLNKKQLIAAIRKRSGRK